MASGSNEIDEIYQRMAVIRREHHTNVRESVAGAEAMADWGRYTWTYPWIAFSAAVGVAYLIYTSGHQKSAGNNLRLADGAEAGEPVTGARASGQERSWGSRNLLIAAWDILSPVAVRAGQNYMLHLLEQQFRPRTVDRTAPTPEASERHASMSKVER